MIDILAGHGGARLLRGVARVPHRDPAVRAVGRSSACRASCRADNPDEGTKVRLPSPHEGPRRRDRARARAPPAAAGRGRRRRRRRAGGRGAAGGGPPLPPAATAADPSAGELRADRRAHEGVPRVRAAPGRARAHRRGRPPERGRALRARRERELCRRRGARGGQGARQDRHVDDRRRDRHRRRRRRGRRDPQALRRAPRGPGAARSAHLGRRAERRRGRRRGRDRGRDRGRQAGRQHGRDARGRARGVRARAVRRAAARHGRAADARRRGRLDPGARDQLAGTDDQEEPHPAHEPARQGARADPRLVHDADGSAAELHARALSRRGAAAPLRLGDRAARRRRLPPCVPRAGEDRPLRRAARAEHAEDPHGRVLGTRALLRERDARRDAAQPVEQPRLPPARVRGLRRELRQHGPAGPLFSGDRPRTTRATASRRT